MIFSKGISMIHSIQKKYKKNNIIHIKLVVLYQNKFWNIDFDFDVKVDFIENIYLEFIRELEFPVDKKKFLWALSIMTNPKGRINKITNL
jgi:hypothetical protein